MKNYKKLSILKKNKLSVTKRVSKNYKIKC